jgi:cytoskeletal protein CcmA (bactofilin family)
MATPRNARFVPRGPVAATLALLSLCVLGCRPSVPLEDEGIAVRRGGDFLAARADVAVRDTVAGDVMMAGGDLRFSGAAGGDILAAGGSHRLAGSAAGSVRAAGGEVRLATRVGRNVTVAGGRVVIERRGHVAGNAYLVGNAVRLDGTVDDLARIAGRDVELNGTVRGDVLVEAGALRVGPNAVIEGDLRYRLTRGQEAEIHADARVDGAVLPLGPRPRLWIRGGLRLLRVLGFLVAGAVAVALLPGLTLAAEARVRERPAASLASGLGLLVVLPLILVAIAITIIGIPLALAAGAIFAGTAYLAPAVVGVWVGRLLVPGGAHPTRGRVVVAFLAGGLILAALSLAPYLGIAVRVLAAALGLGALTVALWEGTLEPLRG